VPTLDPAIRALCETHALHRALGHEGSERELASFVRDPELPDVWDANHVAHVRADGDAAIEALFAEADAHYAHCRHRQYNCDPLTPPRFEARLLHEGYRVTATVQMLLEDELRATPPRAEIRPVESAADWESYAELRRLDHAEGDDVPGRVGRSLEVSAGLVACARKAAPEVQPFLLRLDGGDVAYASSFAGRNGVGIVEDVFTRREQRGRGLATALIACAVRHARAGGAGPVLIGARPGEAAGRLYAKLGFVPVCVARSYNRLLDRGR
jgi:GNAT superfamily N-acetyltransferase